jgi:thiamine-monophosphate kinase
MKSSEFQRIARLRALYASHEHGDVLVDIGDDAAVIEPGIVLSVDAAIEDVHFRRAWIGKGATWEDVGRRAASAALSDLAAMGARPRAMLQSLTLPKDTDDEILEAIARGTAETARQYDAKVIGGNLARGRDLTITTTVVGATDDEPILRREGALPGDALYVTGTIGAASLGLWALESGKGDTPEMQFFVRRFLTPVARINEARVLRHRARAAIDISDGLVQDVRHVCDASGVGVEIDVACLPLAERHFEVAQKLGCDPMKVALTGGEDFELAFAAPHGLVMDGVTQIGRFVSGAGVALRTADGTSIQIERAGFDHFI